MKHQILPHLFGSHMHLQTWNRSESAQISKWLWESQWAFKLQAMLANFLQCWKCSTLWRKPLPVFIQLDAILEYKARELNLNLTRCTKIYQVCFHMFSYHLQYFSMPSNSMHLTKQKILHLWHVRSLSWYPQRPKIACLESMYGISQLALSATSMTIARRTREPSMRSKKTFLALGWIVAKSKKPFCTMQLQTIKSQPRLESAPCCDCPLGTSWRQKSLWSLGVLWVLCVFGNALHCLVSLPMINTFNRPTPHPWLHFKPLILRRHGSFQELHKIRVRVTAEISWVSESDFTAGLLQMSIHFKWFAEAWHHWDNKPKQARNEIFCASFAYCIEVSWRILLTSPELGKIRREQMCGHNLPFGS